MSGIGQTPPDYSSPSGQFRLLAQDTTYSPLNPAQVGQGLYDLFSDAEVSGYLAMYEDYSIYRAVGAAYQGLAGRAAVDAKMVKDYDLQVDLTKRAASLQAIADAMLERAEREDQLSGASSTFGLTEPACDPRTELYFELPNLWGISPLQYAEAAGPFGSSVALDIANIGDGIYGEGVTVTDGSESGTATNEIFDGGELL